MICGCIDDSFRDARKERTSRKEPQLRRNWATVAHSRRELGRSTRGAVGTSGYGRRQPKPTFTRQVVRKAMKGLDIAARGVALSLLYTSRFEKRPLPACLAGARAYQPEGKNRKGPRRFIRRVNKLPPRFAMRKLLHLPHKVAGAERYEKADCWPISWLSCHTRWQGSRSCV
jgi:hypothetical protein